jgi:cell wall-associated NlpC family hydrolase
LTKLIQILLASLLLLLFAGPGYAQQQKKPVQKKQTEKSETGVTKKTQQKPSTQERQTEKPKSTKKTSASSAAKKKKKKHKTAVKKQQPKKQELTVIEPGRICNDSLISFAKKFLGTHYKYANCTPESGFDCSGFVYYVFGQFGVKVPRSSIDYGSLEPTVPKDSAKVGDVIVFTGTNAANRNAGHVGIVISNPGEDLTFIQSSSSKKKNGVIITNFNSSPYYEKRFIKIVRLQNVTIEACASK